MARTSNTPRSWWTPREQPSRPANKCNDEVSKPSQPETGTSDFAWRVHDAVGDWTARVDTKASIALAIETAAAGFVITLATGDGILAQTSGWSSGLLGVGSCLLVLSVAVAIGVVFPQLRARKTKEESKENFIYFGHLRHWQPADLEKRLGAANPLGLTQLSVQLVNMSKIAWRKHVTLQWSLALFLVAVMLVGGALIVDLSSLAAAATDLQIPDPTLQPTPFRGATP